MVYRHYLRALSRWPKDPLRPETQFQDFIRRRVDRTFGVAPAAPSSAAATPQSALEKPLDEARELEQVNALYSLLEGRYAQKVYISLSTILEIEVHVFLNFGDPIGCCGHLSQRAPETCGSC